MHEYGPGLLTCSAKDHPSPAGRWQCQAVHGWKSSFCAFQEAVVILHRVFELFGMWAAAALGVCVLWIATLEVFKMIRGR
jgi:hypothetical protein